MEEAVSGGAFLETYSSDPPGSVHDGPPLYVLMDVNMPGLNGFETIEEAEVRVQQKRGQD